MSHEETLRLILADPVKRAVLERVAPEVFEHLNGMLVENHWARIHKQMREIEKMKARKEIEQQKFVQARWTNNTGSF